MTAVSLLGALPLLRRPFTPQAIRFKVQSTWPKGQPTGALVVAYVDARLVTERLNMVVPEDWSAAYRQAPDAKHLWCDLSVFGVTRSDVGQSPKGFSKDLVSDALKRAAVHFGVSVSVYALPQITLNLDDKGFLRRTGQGDRASLALTEKGHAGLRAGYEKWLKEHGTRLFGEALDHGDVEGATMDDEAGEDVFEPTPVEIPEDPKTQALLEAARAVYDEIRGRPGAPTPGAFNATLEGCAARGHDELGRYVDWLTDRRDALADGVGVSS
jgi:hypothetical protein